MKDNWGQSKNILNIFTLTPIIRLDADSARLLIDQSIERASHTAS